MKSILLQILATLFVVASCNNSQNDGNKIYQNSDSLKTSLLYEPSEYFEESLDTIINAKEGLQLNIKRYPLMNKGFEERYEYGDNEVNIIHYRDFAADIKLNDSSSVIYSQTIQKEFFNDFIEDKSFLPIAYLSATDLMNYNQEKNEIYIRCIVVKIESDYSYIFQLTINNQGLKDIELLEVN